jgi:hypothetical protein
MRRERRWLHEKLSQPINLAGMNCFFSEQCRQIDLEFQPVELFGW